MPPVHTNGKPKLVNRGAAGLLTKLTPEQKEEAKTNESRKQLGDVKDLKGCRREPRIHPSITMLEVDIDTLVADPMNARTHGKRNMEAIIKSFYLYGQTKPIVVRKGTNVVVAGNGSLVAMKHLEWETVAASIVEMTDAEAAAYGIADNRTAELAEWDYEVMKRLDKLIQEEEEYDTPGWTLDELIVLRQAEWSKPVVDEGASFNGEQNEKDNVIEFDETDMDVLRPAIEMMRKIERNDGTTVATCIRLICAEWLQNQGVEETSE